MKNAAKSTLAKKQIMTVSRIINDGKERIDVTLRYDDEHGNGHNTFSITGAIYEKIKTGYWRHISGGCIHKDIAKYFPEYRHLIKWHLVSSDEPMHYIANTVYHAGNRDYNGLLKGEKRQIKNGRTGLPAWNLVGIDKNTGEEIELYNLEKSIDATETPDCPYSIEYRPWCNVGEGKERDFDAARSSAVWPEATEEQLSLPADQLTALLKVRHPELMAEFKRVIESLNFEF